MEGYNRISTGSIQEVKIHHPSPRTLFASDEFSFEQTVIGVVMIHRKHQELIPWWRITSVTYSRKESRSED